MVVAGLLGYASALYLASRVSGAVPNGVGLVDAVCAGLGTGLVALLAAWLPPRRPDLVGLAVLYAASIDLAGLAVLARLIRRRG